MMNTNKHYEFFQPDSVTETIHIIGCGAIGSTIAFFIAKLGLTKIVLWDNDIVEEKNVANQMYRFQDVGKPKTEALKEILIDINPDIENSIELRGLYTDQVLEGYVFLAVDSIDCRKAIVENNKFNLSVVAMFDFRMRLEDAQHFAADWSDVHMKDNLIKSMDFTQKEADEQTPRSACNETLSIFYTIGGIVSEGIANFVQFTKDRKNLKKTIFYNTNQHTIDAF